MNSLGKELSPAVGKGLVGRMVGGGVTAAVTGSGVIRLCRTSKALLGALYTTHLREMQRPQAQQVSDVTYFRKVTASCVENV